MNMLSSPVLVRIEAFSGQHQVQVKTTNFLFILHSDEFERAEREGEPDR